MLYKGYIIDTYWEDFIVSKIPGGEAIAFSSIQEACDYIDKEVAIPHN